MSTIKKVSVNGQVYDLVGAGGGSSQIIEITYSELKALVDSSSLIPGTKYRITDYVTMTNPEETDYKSAEHPFDIVVSAISTSVLSPEASALRRQDDDGYFSNSKLEQWKLLYTIDNNTELYDYCDPNGKGVIYQMTDEFENMAYFDFKNIMSLVSPSYNSNIKSEGLYFYILSFIDENTSGTISSQEHINDATVQFDDFTKNKFFVTPSIRQSVVVSKSVIDDLLKTHSVIKKCEFYARVFFISLSSVSLLRLYTTFWSSFNISNLNTFKGIFTGYYPEGINKISSRIPDHGIASIMLRDCEFNMSSSNNSYIRMGVSEIEGLKLTILEGNGASVSIMSTKFNHSLVYLNCLKEDHGVDAFLVDALLPEGLSDFSGCEVHLYARKNQVNSIVYSITTGYAIDRNGTVHKLIEFDSSTLDPEYTPA